MLTWSNILMLNKLLRPLLTPFDRTPRKKNDILSAGEFWLGIDDPASKSLKVQKEYRGASVAQYVLSSLS